MRSVRERLNSVFHWEEDPPVPNMDFGYWEETIEIWHDQGLPAEVKTSVELEKYVGIEGFEMIPWTPVSNGFYPCLETRIVEDKGDHLIQYDGTGNLCEVPKKGSSIAKYIRYAIETREDWERFRDEHLDYRREDRTGDVKKAVEEAHAAGMPIRFDAGSIYGWIRNWMGVENLSIAVLTEPEWVEEMMEHLTVMTIHLVEKAFTEVVPDSAWWWEDMCYNHGPLLSPQIFEDLMVPRYKRITDVLKARGVDVNVLDCDGCIYELVAGWLRGGINCMFPVEAAHSDAVRLREEYGNEILLVGNVNKVELAKGKEAIDRELERLRPLVEKGGFVPCVDHRVPPDVSFENYCYYIEKKKAILEV